MYFYLIYIFNCLLAFYLCICLFVMFVFFCLFACLLIHFIHSFTCLFVFCLFSYVFVHRHPAAFTEGACLRRDRDGGSAVGRLPPHGVSGLRNRYCVPHPGFFLPSRAHFLQDVKPNNNILHNLHLFIISSLG